MLHDYVAAPHYGFELLKLLSRVMLLGWCWLTMDNDTVGWCIASERIVTWVSSTITLTLYE
jgi:hypothetical protein